MTWYSIISVAPNLASDERLNLAIFVRDQHDGVVYVSKNRLTLLKSLVSKKEAAFISGVLKDQQQRWQESLATGAIVPFLGDFSESRYDYLSKHSNNLITFTKPKSVSLPYSEALKAKLIENFLGESEENVIAPKKNPFESFTKGFYKQFDQRINLDYKVQLTDLKTLAAPVRVDAIGRNHVPYISQGMDFSKSPTAVYNKATDLQALYHAFVDLNEKPVIHILGKEPKRNTEQHSLWSRLREINYLRIVPKGEEEFITNYIEEHNVGMFVEG